MPSRTTTAAATVVLGLFATAAARASLRVLELRMRTSLDRTVASPTQMFAASSDE